MSERRQVYINRIIDERLRQEELKASGKFRYTCADAEMLNSERLTVLVEEVGEVARAVLETGNLANDKHQGDVKKELVQVAAVCLAWLEATDKPAEF